jgi:hypothetical protein
MEYTKRTEEDITDFLEEIFWYSGIWLKSNSENHGLF